MSDSTISNRLTRQSSKSIENFLKLSENQDRVKETTKNYQKELHQQRLETIRNNLNEVKKDDWKYLPIDSSLGSCTKS